MGLYLLFSGLMIWIMTAVSDQMKSANRSWSNWMFVLLGAVLCALSIFLIGKIGGVDFLQGEDFFLLFLLVSIISSLWFCLGRGQTRERNAGTVLRIFAAGAMQGLVLYLLQLIVQMTIVYLFFDLSNLSYAVLMIRSDLKTQVIYILLTALVWGLISFYFSKKLTFLKKVSDRTNGLLFLGFGLMFVLVLFYGRGLFTLRHPSQVTYVLLYGMIALVSLMVIGLMSFSEKDHEKEKQLSDMDHTNQLISAGYQSLSERQQELSRQAHDFKNHLQVIRGLADRQQEGIISYIDELLSSSQGSSSFHTGSQVVDAVLNAKQQLCEEKKIRFSAEIHLPDELHIQPSDLCILLSNQLDNAIDACLREEKVDALTIRMTIDTKEDFVFLMTENTCTDDPFDGDLPASNKHLPSKKTEPGHGMGLKNMEYIAAKYDGSVQSSWDSGIFSSVIMFQNHERKGD